MEEAITRNIPLIALRALTAFPQMNVSFDITTESAILALDHAVETEQDIFLVTRRSYKSENFSEKDLYTVGTVARIRQVLRISDHLVRVMLDGVSRAKMKRLWQTEPYAQAQIEFINEPNLLRMGARTEAMIRQTYTAFAEYAELVDNLPDELLETVVDCKDPGFLADFLAQHLNLRHTDKQEILEELRPVIRLRKLNEILNREISVVAMEQDIENKTRARVNQIQKDMIMREHIKVLKNELGEGDEDDEADAYRARFQKANLPKETRDKLLRDVERLTKQPFGSAEASVLRNYLDVCSEMPWNVETKEHISVAQARKVLDRDHFGLEKIKERILEFIAVRQLKEGVCGDIICLVGPPGVGKTSIALSVAKALNRKVSRISLGGVRDEADIRGHRKTYIGAMPGRIIEAISRSGSMNPVLVLDEIDKLCNDSHGDPASALLEVLDSEQNSTFRDHYLEIPVDLSKVLFITTANTLDTVPRPLLDRMEIIEIPSYTDEEKFQIALRYLLPKSKKACGLATGCLRLDDSALRAMIAQYTHESGVRQLERVLKKLCRKTAMKLACGAAKRVTVFPDDLVDYLGVPPLKRESVPAFDSIGLVNGLAWTEAGGELLPVEVNVMEGTGKLELTGNLGDVMQESCKAAMSALRMRAKEFGIPSDFYKTKDIHIHFPEGAVPKDGPSAGAAIATAILSALTGQKVRRDVAMTGEITLRGRIMPIGGLREKTMGALRAGAKTVILPKANEKDLAEIDQSVRAQLRFVAVDHLDAVLAEALCPTYTSASNENDEILSAANGCTNLLPVSRT